MLPWKALIHSRSLSQRLEGLAAGFGAGGRPGIGQSFHGKEVKPSSGSSRASEIILLSIKLLKSEWTKGGAVIPTTHNQRNCKAFRSP